MWLSTCCVYIFAPHYLGWPSSEKTHIVSFPVQNQLFHATADRLNTQPSEVDRLFSFRRSYFSFTGFTLCKLLTIFRLRVKLQFHFKIYPQPLPSGGAGVGKRYLISEWLRPNHSEKHHELGCEWWLFVWIIHYKRWLNEFQDSEEVKLEWNRSFTCKSVIANRVGGVKPVKLVFTLFVGKICKNRRRSRLLQP